MSKIILVMVGLPPTLTSGVQIDLERMLYKLEKVAKNCGVCSGVDAVAIADIHFFTLKTLLHCPFKLTQHTNITFVSVLLHLSNVY